jgi:hypothetical protein
MRYLCLAYEEEKVLNDLSQAEWQALRQETLDYVQSLLDSGKLIDTQPLQSARKAAVVQVRGGKTSVVDGPFAETKEQIGGYFMIEAADFDEAVKIAAAWPSARIGRIEVRPIEDELSMERRYG